MYRDFGTILFLVFMGIVLIYAPLVIQKLLAPNDPNADKLATYECGEESEVQLGFNLTSGFMSLLLFFSFSM